MTPVGRESSALSVRLPSLRPRLRLFGAAVAMSLGFVGCASQDVYQARDLPAHMHAPHIENAKTLELSRLAPVGYNEDMIDIDDVLEVHIQVSLNPQDNPPVMQPVVNKAGNISIVSVGEVRVQGLELQAAGSAIAAACIERGIYRAPQVTVLMSKKATNTVMVVGAVATEGPCKLPRGSSNLFTALVYAGMLADNAGTQVEVRNPPGPNSSLPDRIAGEPGAADIAQAGHSQSLPTSVKSSASSFRVDLVSATKPGVTGSYQLQDGAIVMVERRDPEPIYVSGLVTKSGPIEYPLGTGINLLSAIAEAGGPSNRGANKVYIIRKLAGQPQPVMIEASIRAAKRNSAENLMLSPGDQLSVEQTPATVFIDTVNLIRFAVGTSLTPLL